jgi:hypothetical protein
LPGAFELAGKLFLTVAGEGLGTVAEIEEKYGMKDAPCSEC